MEHSPLPHADCTPSSYPCRFNSKSALALLTARRYAEDMELEDAIHTALLTLKEGFEGALGRGGCGAVLRWGIALHGMHARPALQNGAFF